MQQSILKHFYNPQTTVISCSSTHPFKYASSLSVQFFWQKLGFYFIFWTCRAKSFAANVWIYAWHWMSVCWRFVETSQMINAVHHTFVQLSVWTSQQSNWLSISRAVLCRVTKPLKSVALSDSTNVSIGWICCNMFSWLSQTFRMAPSLTSYSSPNACLLDIFGLLNFAMISHRWALVK